MVSLTSWSLSCLAQGYLGSALKVILHLPLLPEHPGVGTLNPNHPPGVDLGSLLVVMQPCKVATLHASVSLKFSSHLFQEPVCGPDALFPSVFLRFPLFPSSDDDLSEEDLNQCEKEDPLHEEDQVPHPGSGEKEAKKKKNLVSSGR